jgi:hypothetical protein
MKKLGSNAYPFTFTFPPNSPCSVTLQPGDDDTAKPLGVEYNVKTYVADSPDDKSHKRSSVSLTIKKVTFPQTNREKTIIFCLKKGKVIPVTDRGGQQGFETSRLPHFLDNRLTDGGEVVSLMCW